MTVAGVFIDIVAMLKIAKLDLQGCKFAEINCIYTLESSIREVSKRLIFAVGCSFIALQHLIFSPNQRISPVQI